MNINQQIIPRRWQSEALEIWAKNFRGVAQVVTGGGKTIFSYLCLEKFFTEYPDGKAIIIVPTLALLDQWFLDICDATSIEESEIACFSGHSRPKQPARINILVLNSARLVAQDLTKQGPSMLIVDECHRAGAIQNCRALKGIHEATLGLSATPIRERDDGFETKIVPALGPIIYCYDYIKAKADNVIVDFDLVNIEISLDHAAVKKLITTYKQKIYDMGQHSCSSEVDQLFATSSRKITRSAEHSVRTPWAAKVALSHKGERVIIFHERIASLRTISNLLSKFQQNSVIYHSYLSEAHRRDNLRLFRRGMVNALITCRALDEGANVPEANIAIIAHSTSSLRQRIQRLGRVLRPAPGKKIATVYTLYSGEEQRARLVKEAKNLEGVANVRWKRGSVQ